MRKFDRLSPLIAGLEPARPLTRWHLLGAGLVIWLVFTLIFPAGGRNSNPFFLFGGTLFLILLYFLPERLYGTTIGLLEGRLLRVVDALDEILRSGEMGFTQAAYFQVRDNLAAARRELRLQIDLAYRAQRG